MRRSDARARHNEIVGFFAKRMGLAEMATG
jgi:hypothetical protein